MPDRQEVAQVTCPANTLATAPVEVPLPWIGGIVRRIEIVIPDGHAGLTGIALGYAHQQTIPRTGNTFYSGNDDRIPMDINDKVPGVAWSAFLCNLDLQAHSWEVRFELDEIVQASTTLAPSFIAPADLLAAAQSAVSG